MDDRTINEKCKCGDGDSPRLDYWIEDDEDSNVLLIITCPKCGDKQAGWVSEDSVFATLAREQKAKEISDLLWLYNKHIDEIAFYDNQPEVIKMIEALERALLIHTANGKWRPSRYGLRIIQQQRRKEKDTAS